MPLRQVQSLSVADRAYSSRMMRLCHQFFFVALFFLIFSTESWATSKAQVRVVVLNLENFRWETNKINTSEKGENISQKKFTTTIRLLARLRPDILFLAEVGGEMELKSLQSALKKSGLSLSESRLLEANDKERKIALLTHFKILKDASRSNLSFSLSGQALAMERGILDVTLKIPNKTQLRVIGLHLKSRLDSTRFDQANFRLREAYKVREHLDQIFSENKDTNLLLLGDMNSTPNEETMKILSGVHGDSSYLQSIPLQDTRGEVWTHFWKEGATYSKIDYILASQKLAASVIRKKSGIDASRNSHIVSDHRAIFVTFEITSSLSDL
ncbi:MAG: endonuclease/exonuclease/phosphatase family protein [Chthoniobacterales bacterium]